MPKDRLKKFIPSPSKLKSMGLVHVLGDQIHNPNLWHLNRRSAAGAAFIGVFCAFQPMPFQMFLAALLALWLHKNLPLSITFVWLSNPLTYGPMFYLNYSIGALLIGESDHPFSIQLSLEWLTNDLLYYWQPLILGSVIVGTVAGATSYVLMKAYWRWKVMKSWQKRIEKRRRQLADDDN
ncbi:MAG: DUF2062 domain-containing protein [Pseudomonadales bacterium]|nr:DUF2062 domain-containing protein [Pseudomonadales bacterium]